MKEADGGLLFLDEIDELGLDEQVMILHAVESSKYFPLGSDYEVTSRFHLIAGANGWLHRKGAAKADGPLIPLAGSRATPSYLLQPVPDADGALQSCAHGAGRRYDRSSMHGRVRARKSDVAQMQRNPFGGRIICEDKALLVEEAPQAYKSSETVVAGLEKTGVARPVAKFHPLVTFKKTRKGGRL